MIQLGIIGFGRIGAEHAGWISQAEGIEVAAVADATPARLDLARQRGLAVVERDALLADPAIDAVLVATPTALHFENAQGALKAGKHVMVEKPVTLTSAQAIELAELATKNQRVLSVFHNRRWDPDFLAVRQAIQSGVFGKLINVESRLGQWSSCVGPAAREWRPQWRNEAAFGGGGLYDWGSHFVDQLWQLMLPAKPLRVFAQLRGNVWSTDCDDFARVLIDFDNGACGLIEINTTTTQPLPRWHIDGARGSASSPASLAFDVNVWASLRFTSAEGQERLLERAPIGLSEREIWKRFAQAVKGKGDAAVTMDGVMLTMQLLDAARESSRTGMAVSIPPY